MDTIVTWIATGFVAGWFVRISMASRREFGVVGDLVLGSLGGVVGGWVFKHFGLTAPDSGPAHVFVALTGAAALVALPRLLRRMMAVGAATFPSAVIGKNELDRQMTLLSDFERRILERMLVRKPTTDDPNSAFDAQLTFGQRVADRVAAFGGSWTFIGLFFLILVVWMIVNNQLARPFDPYPFILLNLLLSCVAALQAPVIMMSQNRMAAKDRLDARSDYEVNLRSEIEIMGLHSKFDTLREREWSEFLALQREQLDALRRIETRLRGASDGTDTDGR